MSSETRKIFLNFHGATASVASENAELLAWLTFDFSSFIVPTLPAPPEVIIEAAVCDAPWNIIPELVESMRSPEYVCFDDKNIRFVNYFGRALVRFDYETETAQMYSPEPDYLYEKLYLLLLSRTGETLDLRGLHRIHGLGVAVAGRASLFLMPSGGGKSTLALSLLNEPDVKLLSEDTPLLNNKGLIYPFPLRLGISKKQIPDNVPSGLVRVFHRERWGTKYLLHVNYFKDSLQSDPVPLRYIFSGKWINSDTPRIERIGRFSILLTLLRDCVFGLGLPQIVEFFLTTDPGDLFRKAGIAFRRVVASFSLAFRCTPYKVLLSRNLEANRDLVLHLLREA